MPARKALALTLLLTVAMATAWAGGASPGKAAAVELNWTPLRLPTGERTALLGGAYLLALGEDWRVGPTVYGAAQGDHGGIFTVGFTAQRHWRLGPRSQLVAGLYAGAGGGLSSERLRFGGGLMLRPELSLRTELGGGWYGGLALSELRFPVGRGNVRDQGLALVLGRSAAFHSHAPGSTGHRVRSAERSGMGFDEMLLLAGAYEPRTEVLSRGGVPARRIGFAGAALRQYPAEGRWWALEAAGAASGGADGYMEILAGGGQDFELLRGSGLRLGWSLAAGLGGGGDVDTGSGWLLRAGPALRWQLPGGGALHLDGGATLAVDGGFKARHLRLALGLPLDHAPRPSGAVGEGRLRDQSLLASFQHLPKVRFKDGREESLGHLGLSLSRDWGGPWYGSAQAGSAAFGTAGAYSYGLFGLGLQGRPWRGGPQFGAELLVGAAGGGGVAIQGGAVAQAEAWAQWQFGAQDRVRLRAGVGQWRTLRGHTQASPLVHLALGYAFGAVHRSR